VIANPETLLALAAHDRNASRRRVVKAGLLLGGGALGVGVPGAFDPVTVGGGLRWQSGFYGNIYSPIANDYTRIMQGGYYGEPRNLMVTTRWDF